ncbi:hypothetical protein CYMTET_31269 [Cymbomonas tetramitiformis]|uniref:SEC7 domain-containing protein n=1 Tax=Cymbomonas tetramitiformis TaxID=36881 RepID=A0AAE0KT26_9CHLO|nr:hypothetical protein CYMTET_31269 [Cymbomonas tetramitiformis]|eukprot:gene24459-29740_t
MKIPLTGERVVMLADGANHSAFLREFNDCSSPKEVLKLVDRDGLSAAELGRILCTKNAQRVSVNLLGACLGHHHEFWKVFADEYPQNFNFSGLKIVSAIRNYLWHFRLPGESAMIYRIMEGFSKAFFNQNAPPEKPRCGSGGVSSISRGWYVKQPQDETGAPICSYCGNKAAANKQDCLNSSVTDKEKSLSACHGCKLISFCHPCLKRAGQCGHAGRGILGYGRACVAARCLEAGALVSGITYYNASTKQELTEQVNSEFFTWERVSPFLSADSVNVMAYAIIMLTTDLHNPTIKRKMCPDEFFRGLRGVNEGQNFPSDFVSDIYYDIKTKELEIMK